MENMNYNLDLKDDAKVKSLNILVNQCWKILPIYEGRDRDKNITFSKQEAYENYQKHLSFLITKVSGASKIWKDNRYYVELLYLLNGMTDFGPGEHDRVKYLVHHIINLIKNMEKEVLDSEIL